MSFPKCLITAGCILIFFCGYGDCLNLSKINGTWIVRNTSDPTEAGSCPFVTIDATPKRTILAYESNMTGPFNLTMNTTSSKNFFTLKDSLNNTGNLTVYGGNLPFYVVVGVKVQKVMATFLVLTGHITVPGDQLKNISKLINSTAELQKVRFYPVDVDSKACKSFLVDSYDRADGGYPDVKNEVITWSDVTTTTTARPTTKKPNSASGLYVSYSVVLISMLFLCSQ